MNISQIKDKIKQYDDFNISFNLYLPLKEKELKLRSYKYPYDTKELNAMLDGYFIRFFIAKHENLMSVNEFCNSDIKDFHFDYSVIPEEMYDIQGKTLNIQIDDIGHSDKIILISLNFD